MSCLSLVAAARITVINQVKSLDHLVILVDKGFKKEEVHSIVIEEFRKAVAISFNFKTVEIQIMKFMQESQEQVNLSRIKKAHLGEVAHKVDFDLVIKVKSLKFNQRGHFMEEFRLVS
jgi:hypothetical protein